MIEMEILVGMKDRVHLRGYLEREEAIRVNDNGLAWYWVIKFTDGINDIFVSMSSYTFYFLRDNEFKLLGRKWEISRVV